VNNGNQPLIAKGLAMVFSEYLSAAKGAITYVKSQVRYRGLNTGGGWIRDPLDVPQKFAARITSLNMASEKRGRNGVRS
jgi:hypothetical protein